MSIDIDLRAGRSLSLFLSLSPFPLLLVRQGVAKAKVTHRTPLEVEETAFRSLRLSFSFRLSVRRRSLEEERKSFLGVGLECGTLQGFLALSWSYVSFGGSHFFYTFLSFFLSHFLSNKEEGSAITPGK